MEEQKYYFLYNSKLWSTNMPNMKFTKQIMSRVQNLQCTSLKIQMFEKYKFKLFNIIQKLLHAQHEKVWLILTFG